MIRPVTPADAAVVCPIYNHYVENTVISFGEKAPAIPEMKKRIGVVSAGLHEKFGFKRIALFGEIGRKFNSRKLILKGVPS